VRSVLDEGDEMSSYYWDVRYAVISDDGMPFGMADVVSAAGIESLPAVLAAGHGVPVGRIEVTFASRYVLLTEALRDQQNARVGTAAPKLYVDMPRETK
jgi:hypothetical protein